MCLGSHNLEPNPESSLGFITSPPKYINEVVKSMHHLEQDAFFILPMFLLIKVACTDSLLLVFKVVLNRTPTLLVVICSSSLAVVFLPF